MKNKKVLIMLAVMLMLACLMVSCGADEMSKAEFFVDTTAMLDGLLANDFDVCYALVEQAISREDFQPVYDEWRAMLTDVTTYELTPTSWHMQTENGVTETTRGYTMKTDSGKFVVEAAVISTTEGFSSFYITPQETLRATGTITNMTGANAGQWLFLAVALAETVFVIWAVVDCARHAIPKKGLWIVLILLGAVTLSLTLSSANVNLRWNIGTVTAYTSFLRYGTGEMLFRVMIPVGAIVYVTQRRKLLEKGKAEAEDVLSEDETASE